MTLDLSTVLLQWAAGGLFGLWVTTRHRVVGVGYGWLLRSTFLLLAVGAVLTAQGGGTGATVSRLASAGVALAAGVALGVSIARRSVGVRGQEEEKARRRERVAAMADRAAPGGDDGPGGREFDPRLDLVAPIVGFVGLLGAASAVGGPYPLSLVRLVTGALLLGAVTDAMLLGHWYLVQPGLARGPIKELVLLIAVVWPIEVAAFLWPTGMAQAFDGTIDDGWGGLLGWTWAVSALTTIGLVGLTWLTLRERQYSAVMAATGLLYLAILTGFGTDLVARAVLAP